MLLLTVGYCWGKAETAVADRLKAELKEVFPYAPPGEEKPGLTGEPAPEREPLIVPRSPAYRVDILAEARRAAAAKAALKLPPLRKGDRGGAGSIREEPDRLTGQEAKSGGISAPTDPRPEPLQKDALEAADSEVVILPKVEVTAQRRTKLEVLLAEIEAQQKSEEKAAETTVLDSILNPPFLNLGGASGNARAAAARRRIEVLGWVKLLTMSREEAKSPEEKARIKAQIDMLKDIMRSWR
jgi:hypothetical protein